MQKINIQRASLNAILKKLDNNPAVALLGARQTGKSTLAKEIVSRFENAIYLDLELESDRIKIETDAELFFQINKDSLICLDEIQLLPDIFKTLRGIIDKHQRNGQFLILGSASRDLINKSGESLAGRISYVEINPFSRNEIIDTTDINTYWVRGGYPRSVFAVDDEVSFDWRDDYIQSFLERDLPSLGFNIPATTLRRFWSMLAHTQGQVINFSKLGASLGVSGHTVKHYIDILEQTFVIRVLPPYFSNTKKRLIKAPKVYIRDTGLLHALLKIETINDLLGHPIAGASYESLMVENIIKHYPRHTPYFYRDSTGNEIDLVLVKGLEKIVFEIKLSTAPKLTKGFQHAVKFLKPTQQCVIAPVEKKFLISEDIKVINIDDFIKSEL